MRFETLRKCFSLQTTKPNQTDRTRPDQIRPNQTRQNQTKPDKTKQKNLIYFILLKSAKIFGSFQSEPKVQSEPNIFLSTLGDVPMSLWGRDV